MSTETKSTTILRPGASLAGWGGLGVNAQEALSEDFQSVTENATLSRGLGRAYGDAALPPAGVNTVAGSRMANRLLDFDPSTGVLKAEAGVSLSSLVDVMLPKGWFTPVSPGTQYVTLGGMVASDVHGKNHHVAGTFGQHVQSLTMRLANNDIVTVDRQNHADLFRATLGGMGLTGHILDVTFKMEKVPSPWIYQQKKRIPNIDAFLDGLEEAAKEFPMTVGWIDLLSSGSSLGRGILMQGRWASPAEAPIQAPKGGISPVVPFPFPNWALNDFTMKAFNTLYYHKQVRAFSEGITSPNSWFYPLDAIQHWYRIYGRRGFTQHQAVIPKAAGRAKVREYIELLSKLGGASFLCVIKDCGPEGEGLLSFPEPGVSVALDIPMRSDTLELTNALNRFVLHVGGRIYLAKDSFTRRQDFQEMEKDRLPKFMEVRRKYDPDLKIRSALSARLIDPETK